MYRPEKNPRAKYKIPRALARWGGVPAPSAALDRPGGRSTLNHPPDPCPQPTQPPLSRPKWRASGATALGATQAELGRCVLPPGAAAGTVAGRRGAPRASLGWWWRRCELGVNKLFTPVAGEVMVGQTRLF